MRKSIIIFLFFLSAVLSAQDYTALIDSAEAHYNSKLYNNAIADYQQVLDAGYESPALYFNVANAYYKAGDLPSAILFYEKALKLAPADEDILYNLEVARNQTIDKIEQVPELFHERWMKSVHNWLNADAWAVSSLVILLFLCLFIGLYFLSRRIGIRKLGFWGALIALLLFVVSFSIAQRKFQRLSSENTAIIFSPSVTIKSSPDKGSVDLFVLHEGAKVDLVDEVGQWYKIRIANGSVGWVEVGSLKKI